MMVNISQFNEKNAIFQLQGWAKQDAFYDSHTIKLFL